MILALFLVARSVRFRTLFFKIYIIYKAIPQYQMQDHKIVPQLPKQWQQIRCNYHHRFHRDSNHSPQSMNVN